MTFLKKTMLASLCLFSFGSLASNEYPVNFSADIVTNDGLAKLWVQLDSEEQFNLLANNVPHRQRKTKFYGISVYLYGIQDIKFEDIKHKKGNKQFDAILNINKILRNKRGNFTCYGRDNIEGTYVCTLQIGNKDFGEAMILDGLSYYSVKGSSRIKEVDDKYNKAEASAKERRVGVWEPYYGIFGFE